MILTGSGQGLTSLALDRLVLELSVLLLNLDFLLKIVTSQSMNLLLSMRAESGLVLIELSG